MDFNNRQIVAVLLSIALIGNLTLLALRKINDMTFWVVLGIIAVPWLFLKKQWKKKT